jgi:hypothetical protein
VDFRLAVDINDARLFTQYAEFGDLLRTHLGARFGRRHPPQPGSSVVPLNGARKGSANGKARIAACPDK